MYYSTNDYRTIELIFQFNCIKKGAILEMEKEWGEIMGLLNSVIG